MKVQNKFAILFFLCFAQWLFATIDPAGGVKTFMGQVASVFNVVLYGLFCI